jgi:hypothetical protein
MCRAMVVYGPIVEIVTRFWVPSENVPERNSHDDKTSVIGRDGDGVGAECAAGADVESPLVDSIMALCEPWSNGASGRVKGACR